MWLNVLKGAVIKKQTDLFYPFLVSVYELIESIVSISITTYSGVLYKLYCKSFGNMC